MLEEEWFKKLAKVKALQDVLKAKARGKRSVKYSKLQGDLTRKLADPKFHALYIMVSCLFAEKLTADV